MPTGSSVSSSSLSQTCWALIRLSRFDRYNSLLALFPSIFATLLAGALRLRQTPDETSLEFVLSQALKCALHCYIFSGAGMVWNDWIDCDIDAKVARTKNRPLASGQVQVSHAILWMAVQYLVAGAILRSTIDDISVWGFAIAFETIGTALYPFGKRPIAQKWHLYPQYILGALGLPLAVSGWAAIYFQEGLGLLGCMKRALPLSLMIFIWTLYYNTAYSYQDIADDRKLGVHSLYVIAGQNIHAFLVCLGVLVLANIAWVLADVESAWLWLSWMGVWTVAYLSQFRHFDSTRPETGGLLHKQNVKLGVWTVFVCIVEVFLAAM